MSMGERWAQPNLLAGYHLEDENDFSGNGYTLTNVNSVTFESGKFAKGAKFTDPAQYLWRNTDAGVSLPNSAVSMICTLKIVVAPSSSYTTMMRWHSQTGTKGRITLKYLNDAGTMKMEVWTDNISARISYPVTLTLNVWNFVAITQTSAGALTLYLNGNEVGTGTHNTWDPGDTAIEFDADGTNDQHFVDEAAFFSKTLSAIEIRRWYGWSKGLLC